MVFDSSLTSITVDYVVYYLNGNWIAAANPANPNLKDIVDVTPSSVISKAFATLGSSGTVFFRAFNYGGISIVPSGSINIWEDLNVTGLTIAPASGWTGKVLPFKRSSVTVSANGPDYLGDYGSNTPGTTTGGIKEALAALTIGRTWKETVTVIGNIDNISESIILQSYTRLELQGKLTCSNNCSIISGQGVLINQQAITGTSYDTDIEVVGGIIDCNKANNTTTYEGIIFLNLKNFVLEKVEVMNSPEDGIVVGQQGAYLCSGQARDCICHDCAATGFVVNDEGLINVSGGQYYANTGGGFSVTHDSAAYEHLNEGLVAIGLHAYQNTGAGISSSYQAGIYPNGFKISGIAEQNDTGFDFSQANNIFLDIIAIANNNSGVSLNAITNSTIKVQSYNNAQSPTQPTWGQDTSGLFMQTMNNCDIYANCFDNQGTPTQKYGIISNSAQTNDFANCTITGQVHDNTTGQYTETITTGGFAASRNVHDLVGFNPQGFAVTTPAVPASGTAQTNTAGYAVRIYLLTGGTGTAVAITDPSGTTQSITVPLAAGQEWTLDPGAKITFTYSAAPTWKWYGI